MVYLDLRNWRGPSAFKTLVSNSYSLEDPIESKDHYLLLPHDACRIYLVTELLLVLRRSQWKEQISFMAGYDYLPFISVSIP